MSGLNGGAWKARWRLIKTCYTTVIVLMLAFMVVCSLIAAVQHQHAYMCVSDHEVS